MGQFVEADEIVAIVETDKVNVDIRSSHSGVITKVFAEEGDSVEVGGDFFEVDTSQKGSSEPAKESAPKKEESAPKQEAPKQDAPKKEEAPKTEEAK